MTCDKCNGSGQWQYDASKYKCDRCQGTGNAMPGIAYAGIGSRSTPMSIIHDMENVAMQLALRGFILRSGHAQRPLTDKIPDTDSADLAFERGCDLLKGRKTIREWSNSDDAMTHARQFHPNWEACSRKARGLHARNSLIMVGDWFDDPVRFVVCYTDGGAVKGGTGQALRIAAAMGIPVFNFGAGHTAAHLWSWLDNG